MNESTEAAALDDREFADSSNPIEDAKELYQIAKAASVGQVIVCPMCRRTMTKRSYQQAFCGNKGRANCKDQYWNRATDQRRERAKFFG